MEPQPDQWQSKLPDGRTVTYTSNIGAVGVGGPIAAQLANEILKYTNFAGGPMTRREIEAVFADVLATK
jgi:hypothetical protein